MNRAAVHVNYGALVWPAWVVLCALIAGVWNTCAWWQKRRLRKRTARLTDAEEYEWARIWARYDCEAQEPTPRDKGEAA